MQINFDPFKILSSFVFIFAGSLTAHAALPSYDDNDYNESYYYSVYQRYNDKYNSALNELNQAESRLSTLSEKELDAQRNYNSVISELNSAQNSLDQDRRRVSDLESTSTQLKRDIGNLEQSIRNLEYDRNRTRDQLNSDQRNYEQDVRTRDRIAQDIGPLKNQLNAANSRLQSAQTAANSNSMRVSQLRSELQRLDGQINMTQNLYDQAKASRDSAPNDMARQMWQNAMDMRQNELNQLRSQKQNSARELQQRESQQSSLDNEVRNRANDVAQIERQIGPREAELRRAENEVSRSESRLRDTQNQLRRTEDDLNGRRSDLVQSQNALQNVRDEQNRLNDEIYQLAQNRIPNLQSKAREWDDYYRRLSSERSQAEYERNAASSVASSCYADAQKAYDRLEAVQANIAEAQRVVKVEANRDAGSDATRAGLELGTPKGKSAGVAEGLKQGEADGLKEAKTRDYNLGYSVGKESGIENGQRRAEADGEANGLRDGTELGRTQGLKVVSELGMKDGLIEGDSNGSDKLAFQRGMDRGLIAGLSEAKEAAKPQEAQGYQDKEKEFRNKPLKEVTVDASAVAQGFNGLQEGSPFDEAAQYYQPRPNSQYPRTVQGFYSEFYDQIFRDVLSEEYSKAYKASFDSSYSESYSASRAQALLKDFPDLREQGRLDAFEAFDKETYAKVYPSIYASKKESYRQQAFSFYSDKTQGGKEEYTKAFAQGNAINSENKGFRDGRIQAYNANLEIERQKAYEAGSLRAKSLYETNSVIEVLSVKFNELEPDGILRPDESMYINVVVKNFGSVAKQGLKSTVKVSDKVFSVTQASFDIPDLQPQSQTTIRGLNLLRVKKTVAQGTSVQVQHSLTDQTQIIKQSTFSGVVNFPATVQVSDFDGLIIPGESSSIRVTVTNNSRIAQSLILTLNYSQRDLSVNKSTQSIKSLSAGKSTVLSFDVKAVTGAQFDSTDMTLALTDAKQIPFAQTVKFSASLARKHKLTQDSTGLVMSRSSVRMITTGVFKDMKIDTWDFRADGSISSFDTLQPYLTKTLYIVLDKQTSIDASTQKMIRSFADQGGDIVVMGTELSEAPMFSALKDVTGVVSSQEKQINSKVVGSDYLAGLKMDIRGSYSVLKPARLSARLVMGDFASMTSSHRLGMSENLSYVLTMGITPEQIELETFKQILTRFDEIRMSFDDKIKKMYVNPAYYIPFIVFEARDEMSLSEEDSGNWYSDKDRTKLYWIIRRIIGDQSNLRSTVAPFFPVVFAEYKRLSKQVYNTGAVLNSSAGFGKPKWPKLYCDGSVNPGYDQALCYEIGQVFGN